MTQAIKEEAADWSKYDCMLSCGRILISPDLRTYALRCEFCATICLRPKWFLTHINEEHMDTVNTLYMKDLQDVEDAGADQPIALEYVEALQQYEPIQDVIQTDFLESKQIDEEIDEEIVIKTEYEPKEEKNLSDCGGDDDESSFDLGTVDYSDEFGDDDDEDDDDDDIDLFDISKRPLYLRIIESYKAKPELWNNEDIMFARRHHKRVLLKNMTRDINEEFKVNLTPLLIRQIFLGLRKLFNAKMQMRQHKEQDGKTKYTYDNDKKSRLWCYKALSFLEQAKTKSQTMLSDEMKLLIAEHYKKHSMLWDREHNDYHDRARRETVLHGILNQLNSDSADGVQITLNQLLLCIQRLRIMCTSNRQARMQGQATKTKYKAPYPAFVRPLSFLNAHIGPFECEVCGDTTLNYNRHKAHVVTHKDDCDSPYQCDICGKVLKNTSTLRLHKRTHTGEMPYECTMCDRKFSNSGNLRVHRRVHTGERPYICDVCGKTFRTCSFLLRHKLYHNPEKFRFRCTMCDKAFGERKRLREHMNSHLNRREYLCDFCGKGFYARKTLRQHEQLHNASKIHSCELCGVLFAQRAGLYSHMKRAHRTVQLKANDVEASAT